MCWTAVWNIFKWTSGLGHFKHLQQRCFSLRRFFFNEWTYTIGVDASQMWQRVAIRLIHNFQEKTAIIMIIYMHEVVLYWIIKFLYIVHYNLLLCIKIILLQSYMHFQMDDDPSWLNMMNIHWTWHVVALLTPICPIQTMSQAVWPCCLIFWIIPAGKLIQSPGDLWHRICWRYSPGERLSLGP